MTHQQKSEKNKATQSCVWFLFPPFFRKQKTHIHAQDVLLNWAQVADPEEF